MSTTNSGATTAPTTGGETPTVSIMPIETYLSIARHPSRPDAEEVGKAHPGIAIATIKSIFAGTAAPTNWAGLKPAKKSKILQAGLASNGWRRPGRTAEQLDSGLRTMIAIGLDPRDPELEKAFQKAEEKAATPKGGPAADPAATPTSAAVPAPVPAPIAEPPAGPVVTPTPVPVAAPAAATTAPSPTTEAPAGPVQTPTDSAPTADAERRKAAREAVKARKRGGSKGTESAAAVDAERDAAREAVRLRKLGFRHPQHEAAVTKLKALVSPTGDLEELRALGVRIWGGRFWGSAPVPMLSVSQAIDVMIDAIRGNKHYSDIADVMVSRLRMYLEMLEATEQDPEKKARLAGFLASLKTDPKANWNTLARETRDGTEVLFREIGYDWESRKKDSPELKSAREQAAAAERKLGELRKELTANAGSVAAKELELRVQLAQAEATKAAAETRRLEQEKATAAARTAPTSPATNEATAAFVVPAAPRAPTPQATPVQSSPPARKRPWWKFWA